MKSLFLIAIASLYGIHAYAQNETPIKWTYAPQTLHCTQEALFLKVSIRSGCRLNSLHLGEPGPVNMPFDFMASRSALTKDTITEPPFRLKLEKTINPHVFYFEKEALFKLKSTQKLSLLGNMTNFNKVFSDDQNTPSPINEYLTIPAYR